MESLSIYAPAFACAALMLVTCLAMMRRTASGRSSDDAGAAHDEVVELQAEAPHLRDERLAAGAHHEVTHD